MHKDNIYFYVCGVKIPRLFNIFMKIIKNLFYLNDRFLKIEGGIQNISSYITQGYRTCVIMPVFNTEKYLDECISSLLQQTYSNFYIIFIDDCSTDSSKLIIERWRKLDSRIKLVSCDSNSGAGVARNIGLKRVEKNTDFVIFLDSDDWFDENFLEKMVFKAVSENADVTVCQSQRRDVNTGKITAVDISFKRRQLCRKNFTPESIKDYIFSTFYRVVMG